MTVDDATYLRGLLDGLAPRWLEAALAEDRWAVVLGPDVHPTWLLLVGVAAARVSGVAARVWEWRTRRGLMARLARRRGGA